MWGEPMRFEILTTINCRWSIRNIVALTEKGADYVLVDVSSGRGKAPWYLALTPFGKTPALRHGRKVIVESLLMNEYIDEVAPRPGLMPLEPAARAWARIWMNYCDNTLMGKVSRLAKSGSCAETAQAVAGLSVELRRAERSLFAYAITGEFWHGERPGLVDMCYWTFFDALERTCKGFVIENPVAAFSVLTAWRSALLACDAFQHADQQLQRLGTRAGLTTPTSKVRGHDDEA
jgi:glutathione S-transferase